MARGFPTLFIDFIKGCVSLDFFSVNLNSSLEGFFSGRRDIQQGDPLSPYLFTLYMDVLSKLLRKKCVGKGLHIIGDAKK